MSVYKSVGVSHPSDTRVPRPLNGSQKWNPSFPNVVMEPVLGGFHFWDPLGSLGLHLFWNNPKGPSTQYLGTSDLSNSNCSIGFGQVYDSWALGPLG